MLKPPHFADHRTGLIRNAWYVAALVEELGVGLLARKILGSDVVLYRAENGSAVALEDRCPHRSMRLSKGRRQGDAIACIYHGMTFDPGGKCIKIPTQDTAPAAVRVRSYPLVERGPFVWIWMGSPEDVDLGSLPDVTCHGDASFQHVVGATTVACNYVRLHENVLDLTHLPYLHSFPFDMERFVTAKNSLRAEEDRLCLTKVFERTDPALNPGVFDPGHRISETLQIWFASPAIHIAYADLKDEDGGQAARTARNAFIHAFTPATATTTNYFWGLSRNTNLGDGGLDNFIRTMITSIFAEDVAALEVIEDVWSNDPDADFQEISVGSDRPGMLMRRIIARLADAEHGPVAPAPAHELRVQA